MEQSFVTPTNSQSDVERPAVLARSLALMKPITWFAPTWAFLCGAVASGALIWSLPNLGRLLLGMVMAGPVLCGISQVINDYFDRDIDAINEPDRLIPSGMVSIRQVALTIAVLGVIGVSLALFLGAGVTLLTGIGLLLAIIYSAPPLRVKRNGWVGNTVVAISYEGLAWLAGHIAFAPLTAPSIMIALFYSLGAHGIMSINDYKSIAGDRLVGIRTIPVQLGVKRAAWLIVAFMDIAQFAVIAAFIVWGQVWVVAILSILVIVQLPLQWRFIKEPEERFLTFSAFGVTIFVWGMLVAAIGLRALS